MNIENYIRNNDNAVAIEVIRIWLRYVEFVRLLIQEQKKFRRWWSKPHIRDNSRLGYGAFTTVFHYFKMHDEEEFFKFSRITVAQFEHIFQLVRPHLQKRSRRPPLPPELRFAAVLNYLAHGDSIQKNSWFFSIGLSTFYSIVPEVCRVLCNVLRPIYVQFPNLQQFENIAQGFNEKLDFPNCFGALDGRHCKIKKPANSGSLFFCHKKFYSIVLMGCCDADMRFTWVNIGDYGSLNDAGIFANSDLGIALENMQIQLPAPTALPRSNIILPHFVLGDGGFPIKRYLMKPYLRHDNMTVEQRVFNYRLSHARRIIESAFGLLSQRWLVNECELDWALPTTELIIMSTVCLHNFLINCSHPNNVMNRPENYNNNVNANILADNQIPVDIQAMQMRETLSRYLVSPDGSVAWQWDRI